MGPGSGFNIPAFLEPDGVEKELSEHKLEALRGAYETVFIEIVAPLAPRELTRASKLRKLQCGVEKSRT